MAKITTEVNGKKYELIESDNGCIDCALNKYCSDWTKSPKWCGVIVCLKIGGVWKEVNNAD